MAQAPPTLVYSDTPDGTSLTWDEEYLDQVDRFPLEAAKQAYHHVNWEPSAQLILDVRAWNEVLEAVFNSASHSATNRSQKAVLARWFPVFVKEYRSALIMYYHAVAACPTKQDNRTGLFGLDRNLRRKRKAVDDAEERVKAVPMAELSRVAKQLFDLAPAQQQVALIFDAGAARISEEVNILDHPGLSRMAKNAVRGSVIGAIVRAGQWDAQRLLIEFTLGLGEYDPPLIDERHPLMKRYRREEAKT